jgi:hypothetical protein
MMDSAGLYRMWYAVQDSTECGRQCRALHKYAEQYSTVQYNAGQFRIFWTVQESSEYV